MANALDAGPQGRGGADAAGQATSSKSPNRPTTHAHCSTGAAVRLRPSSQRSNLAHSAPAELQDGGASCNAALIASASVKPPAGAVGAGEAQATARQAKGRTAATTAVPDPQPEASIVGTDRTPPDGTAPPPTQPATTAISGTSISAASGTARTLLPTSSPASFGQMLLPAVWEIEPFGRTQRGYRSREGPPRLDKPPISGLR